MIIGMAKGGQLTTKDALLAAAGFRAIGCGVPLSAAAAVFINGGLGPKRPRPYRYLIN